MKLGLCLTKGGGETLKCYVDASHDGDERDRHSAPGCVTIIMGAAVLRVRQIQRSTTLSSNESEYVAMCRVTQVVIFCGTNF